MYKCDDCDHEAKTEVLLKKHISTKTMFNEQAHQQIHDEK